ncbi:MAG: hypothetical protein E7096_04730 [Bacteroides sp.]|nr:hypothetical protein [Bacteroides sp.]
MEIRELPDFKDIWMIEFKKNNIDLFEYVIEVANRFVPFFDGFEFSESQAPNTFYHRYIESSLDLRERYERKCSMGYNYSWEEYEKNNKDIEHFDKSFLDKYLDKQLQNTIAAYGLDISKLWYLIVFVNDYVRASRVDFKDNRQLLFQELNELGSCLTDATKITLEKEGTKCFSCDNTEVLKILDLAYEHFIVDYNRIINNGEANYREQLKELGLEDEIGRRSLKIEEVKIEISYQQYKFAEMLLYFLKDKKGITPPHIKEKVFKERHFFVSMLLYVVGLYKENEDEAKAKWYEPTLIYNNEIKDNRNLSNLVRQYKNRKLPPLSTKIYMT